MTESLIIFGVAAVLLFFLVKWLVRSESEDINVEERLKDYGSSEHFEEFYAKHAYKKASQVIKRFEEKFPTQAEKLRNQRASRDDFFSTNKDRYNNLVFKYESELRTLRTTGEKWFAKEDIIKVIDNNALQVLLEAHVISFYDQKYLLKDKYEAEHPQEKDEEGNPVKIEI